LERRPRASASEDAVASIAIAAERAIAAHAGADVELIVDGDRAPWVVQARPVVHPARRDPRPAPPAIVLAPLVADGRRWVWDVAHNPDPLSPAQAALVERVERAGSAPWAMRVCAGYLYTAPRAPTAPPPDRPASIAALAARSREVERRIAAALDEAEPIAGHEPAGREPEPASIEAAVARYLAFYQLWARELVPLAAAARHLAPTSARSARPSALDAALRAAARGERSAASVIEQFGVLAPAWDVAVPTFAEQPSVVSGAIARLRAALASAPTRADPAPRDPDPDRELAEDLGERDDLWFARAQWLVRRALLSRAAAIGLPAEHAGWVPLDALATATAEAVGDLRRTAAAARAAATRATGWAMPATVIRDAEGALGSAEDPPPHQTLHGVGLGGRVTGRVRRFASLATASAAAPVDVVVTRAVTPALAALVAGCAALVSESGGLLDHGAALARELGIPCVVGCRGAWQRLEDGALVTVDGDRGTVTAHDR
jgi:pyruvate,water dikinase